MNSSLTDRQPRTSVIDAGYHEKRLLHHLLDNYNVLERPVVNESDPLQLSFGLTLMQIIDVHSLSTRQIKNKRGPLSNEAEL
uniref:Neurotransmitter-gated ion-channel ligand-binding domain-containing protein n=1 Tax=Anopheles dirus TaxID=7168 RepID=A0A182MZW0_9DIPT